MNSEMWEYKTLVSVYQELLSWVVNLQESHQYLKQLWVLTSSQEVMAYVRVDP